jgi:hypothetical protein
MVRRLALKTGSFALILPEVVSGHVEFPFYGKVTAIEGETATVESLSEHESFTGQVPANSLQASLVTKAEATRLRHRALLRQAAWIQSAGRYWHGQVVGFDGRLARLQLPARTVLVEPSELTAVAPVVALLLRDISFSTDDMSADTLTDVHSTILERILEGPDASNDIAAVLHELVPRSALPTGNEVVQWVDSRTGVERTFRLQHVVDFAYVNDGNNPWPPSLRSSIGHSFCDDPLMREASAVRSAANSGPATQRHVSTPVSLSSLFADAESAHSSNPSPHVPPRTPRRRSDPAGELELQEPPRVRSRTVSAGRPDYNVHMASPAQLQAGGLDTRVIDALVDQPDLLGRYIRLVSSSISPVETATGNDPEPERRTSKYAFAPTSTQISIHDAITAPSHRGKHPTLFVETLIQSTAVRFQPHPGVVMRIFDFQFGLLGLSILHFIPFGIHQRMAWLNKGGVNMQNFSAGVAVPRPEPAESMGTLIDASRVLCRFAQDFFTPPVRDVFEALLELFQRLDSWHTWAAVDLPHLIYWANEVLENFRSRVHSSHDPISSSESVVARISLNDGELQNVLHSSARRPSISHQPGRRGGNPVALREQPGQQSAQPRIPRQIFDLIPKHNGRQICLRYLSVLGCSSGSSDRCNYGSRVHAVPDSLDARVKGHIIQRMGGLGEQFSHL